jgi:hypothetical protein
MRDPVRQKLKKFPSPKPAADKSKSGDGQNQKVPLHLITMQYK